MGFGPRSRSPAARTCWSRGSPRAHTPRPGRRRSRALDRGPPVPPRSRAHSRRARRSVGPPRLARPPPPLRSRSKAPSRHPWRARRATAQCRRRAPRGRGRAALSHNRRAPRSERSRRPSCRLRRRRRARPLTPLELWFALLEEGPHALDPVRGCHRHLVETALAFKTGG